MRNYERDGLMGPEIEQLKKRLLAIENLVDVNFCYSCGACRGVCPVARFSPEFNPREFVVNTASGEEEQYLAPDSVLWLCVTCYNCSERCPMLISPIDVITVLKNLSFAAGNAPEGVVEVARAVSETGCSTMVTDSVQRIRAKVGLEPFEVKGADEISRLEETPVPSAGEGE